MHEAEALPAGISDSRAGIGVSESLQEDHSADRPSSCGSAGVNDSSGPGEHGSVPRGRAGSTRGSTLASLAVFTVALAALVPTVGDLGLTWDEPAYRYSQLMSGQWWEQLARARSR